MKMKLVDMLCCLLVLLLATGGVQRSQPASGALLPSTATLAGCLKSCGPLSFDYPFGIGAGCFRSADFELFCYNDSDSQGPRLYLHDGITEITNDITPDDPYGRYMVASFSRSISLRSEVNVYNMSWNLGSSFSPYPIQLNFIGCDFDMYVLEYGTNNIWGYCSVTCPDEDIAKMAARLYCDGVGCCSTSIQPDLNKGFDIRFVRQKNGRKARFEAHNNNRSSIWDSIDVTMTDTNIFWGIEQPGSAGSRTYDACLNHSRGYEMEVGYSCECNPGYQGNPYITDGCSRDKGYDPLQRKTNCSRWCGDISVPFPFGLEDGCFARMEFQLKCTNSTMSALQFIVERAQIVSYVMYINVNEGLMDIKCIKDKEGLFLGDITTDPSLYVSLGESASRQWAVANLTCKEAQQNKTGYACASINSTCLGVVNTAEGGEYLGYRCKCLSGYDGNPYITDGCKDVDECKIPNTCNEICHNTEGGHYCTECPSKTVYDTATMTCRSSKEQNLILGIAIGISVGFGILLFMLVVIFFIRRWKKHIQRQLQRKHFRHNKGLLLEQLISSDENASDNTKIFSLSELEKATNNFDPTRVVGRGGHGMVYKGILSDQRVVAIKKSKVIEQVEISQFINEVAILSQINHRNIVKLFGCCLETEVPLLVYDFIPNGSLFGIIHANTISSSFVLSWDDCLRIAVEAAGALCYLHSAASVSIFHRDVKSTNILLDGNYTAKVSDFGASRLVPIEQTHVATNIQGTFGYLDPEYYHTGMLNEKSDVYSFGVVLVELLLRKEPIFTNDSGEKQNLCNYFLWEMREKPLEEIVATQVLEEATVEEINDVAGLAETCLRLRGEERPTMKEVEMKLQYVRSKRLRSSQVAVTDEDMQTQALLSGQRGNLPSHMSKNCYSLEQEFMASATIPR